MTTKTTDQSYCQKPDPEVVIKSLFGTDSKGLAEKIKRGEVELPKAGEGANE